MYVSKYGHGYFFYQCFESIYLAGLVIKHMNRLAIFASGGGTNADRICNFFTNHELIKPELILCNKPDVAAWTVAEKHGLPTELIEKERFFRGDAYLPLLQAYKIDWLILAGFLWKMPTQLISAYPQKILNIHPALLPKYGGKGMYGSNVHQAVIDAEENLSGITIHYVDEQYDHGTHLLQATCPVFSGDTINSLATRIHELEYRYYPQVIEAVCIKA